ncbi:receptor L-domain domain-containing protein [Pseudoscourfieldia marina]
MLSAVSGVSADKSTTTTYETTKYVDEYNSGYYGDEYKSGYYPKYKWWAPWTWKYNSNKYNDNKYDSGYDSGYSKYDSGYGYSKYDSKYGVGPYYGKQYEQDEYYPCDTFYPKPKWYSPFTWKYRKYAKFDYYSGPCEVKKEEHCLPFWGKDLPHDASEATWYTVTHASGGGGCHSTETQYFYAKSEAHGLTFTLTNHYYYNEKWVCAIDDISRKSAICTMAGHFGGSYSTPEKCILTFKTHQKGGKCIPHHMELDCGKPPYVETSKFSKIDYRDIPHKDIIQQDLEGCTCDSSDNFLSGTAYTNCQSEPFEGAPITLDNIAMDSALSDNTGSVTVVSFPCVTESFQRVVLQDFGNTFSSLEEVRFANWVTGPAGDFKFADSASFTSIYAPRLTGNPNLEVTIRGNPNLAEVDLCALMEAFEIDIIFNENLVGIGMPCWRHRATNSGSGFDGVCIGDENDQQFLDADLSSLVTGFFSEFFDVCYGGGTQPPLNATTVCGVVPDGLFTTAGCSVTSKACKNPKNTKKGKNNKP